MKTRLLVLVASSLYGCANFDLTRSSPPWPFPVLAQGGSATCAAQACNHGEARLAASTALKFCRDVGNYYERGGRASDSTSLGIGFFGILAGSVFGVTAGGSAAKAWSGLSGATNGLQTKLNDSASGSSALLAKARVVSARASAAATKLELLFLEASPNYNTIVQVSQNAALSCASVNEEPDGRPAAPAPAPAPAAAPAPTTTPTAPPAAAPPPPASAAPKASAPVAATTPQGARGALPGPTSASPNTPATPQPNAQAPAPTTTTLVRPVDAKDSLGLIELKQRALASRQAAIKAAADAANAAAQADADAKAAEAAAVAEPTR